MGFRGSVLYRGGERFERLVIASSQPKSELVGIENGRQKRKLFWLCRCDCGKEGYFLGSRLRAGRTKSCGCLKSEARPLPRPTKYSLLTTSESGKRTYASWLKMLDRCYDIKSKSYENYAGRGIKVCDRWRESFQNFLDDMGPRPENRTIGRKNNDGNYEPDNCRWETIDEQNSNKITTVMIGEEKLVNLCKRLNLNLNRVYQRHIALGWPIEKAILTPVIKYKSHKI